MSFPLHSSAHLQVSEERDPVLMRSAFYLLFAWANIVTLQNASVNITEKSSVFAHLDLNKRGIQRLPFFLNVMVVTIRAHTLGQMAVEFHS
jgi:cadmium resistance protein CadD (predicted permease)